MSDTTTITPEERAEIRRRFEIMRRGHPINGSFSLGVHMDGYLRNYAQGFEVNFISLLDALEQSEARAEKAEANVARLKAERRYLANALSSYGDEDEEMSAEDWEQSARRAVADSEGRDERL